MKRLSTLAAICFILSHTLPLYAQTDLPDTEKKKLGTGLPEQIAGYAKRFSVHTTAAGGGRISWKTGTGTYLDRYICYGESDDPIKFEIKIDQEVKDLKNVKLTLSVWDVDESSGEVDVVYVNGQNIGTLHGANDSWSVNNYSIKPSILVGGTKANPGINTVTVDLTVKDWCVMVDWGEISADAGQMKIVEFIPGANKLAAFKAADIRFKFSEDVDEKTVSDATVKLQYRNAAGAAVDVASTLTVTNNLLTIKPTGDLKDGVKYSITISGNSDGVKGKKGDTLAGPQKYDFATVPDLTPQGPSAGDAGVFPIQVVRNAKQIREKATVMRIYTNKWDKKADVHPGSQLEKVKVKVTLKEGATQITSQEAEAERTDLRQTNAKKKAGTNTVNVFYNWLASLTDGAHSIDVELEPKDQTATPPASFKNSAAVTMKAGKTLKVVYQYIRSDSWAGGVPAADLARMDRMMTNCKAFFRDNFPVKDVDVTKSADIDLAVPLASYTWPHARTVAAAVAADASPYADTVRSILLNLNAWKNKASGTAFVALIPTNFGRRSADSGWGGEMDFTGMSCTVGATAVVEDNKLIFLRDDGGTAGTGANATTVAHEFGHNYSLSSKVFDGTRHTTDTMPTEGYWVTKKLNKSRTEGNSETALQKSLMSKYIEPENERWICDYDYNELFDNVPSALIRKTGAASPHLFIAGGYDLWDRFYLSPVWESDYEPSGAYPNQGDLTLLLFSRLGAQIASYAFPSSTTINGDGKEKTQKSFSFFVPSPPDLGSLQIRKGSAVLKEIRKSTNAPTLSITSPTDGALWQGTRTISWSGADADNEKPLYRVSYSSDGGSTWLALASNLDRTSLEINTAQLPSTRNGKIRIIATDGTLNYTTKDVAITVDNGLAVGLLNPSDKSVNVPVGTTIEASFMTPVAETQITQSTLTLKESWGQAVAGRLTYQYSSKTMTFTPSANLKYNTRYTATVKGGITDESGIKLSSDVTWEFTTGADSSDLSIRMTEPAPSSSNSPVNGNIAVVFSKDLNSSTLTSSSFTVYDNTAKKAVPGTVSYVSSTQSALFTPQLPLAKQNEYKVTLTTALRSADNKALAQNYEYFFVTGSDSIAGVRLAGTYAEAGIDDNSDKLYDWLAIDVDVSAIEAGRYSINGKLADKDDNELVWATSNNVQLNKGTSTIRLLFDGKIINAYRINGPYYLNDLQVYNASNTNFSDWLSYAYTTKAYAYTEFQTSTIPVVMKFAPEDGAEEVPTNSAVTVTFTRAMNRSSIDSTTFYIADRSDAHVPGSITYDSATTTAAFMPREPFRPDSVYRAAVTTGVRDLQGTRLLKQYNWSFTISSTAATGHGSIADLYTYPNPFPHSSLPQGGMYFTYVLDQGGGSVKIRIYTITGDLVKEIKETAAGASRGFNQVYWDGKNEAGKALANGTYVYMIYYKDGAGEEHREKGKFTVLKGE
ncbi:MAG: Ig-like domain-containing protein [Acidobacteriota bacterium]